MVEHCRHGLLVALGGRCDFCRAEDFDAGSLGTSEMAVRAQKESERPDWQSSALDDIVPEKDAINPGHYRSHPSGVECIQITEHMNFTLGNALKYIWRAGLKGDRLEDLRKARWYLDREIERVEQAA